MKLEDVNKVRRALGLSKLKEHISPYDKWFGDEK